jgi:hypothetical protein
MPTLEVLVDRLTLRLEVREKACVLLRAVHSKTRPGTSYDIGEAKLVYPSSMRTPHQGTRTNFTI